MNDPLAPGYPARLHTAAHPGGVDAHVRLRADGLVVTAGGVERVWHYSDLRLRGGAWDRETLSLEHDDGREMVSVKGAAFAAELRREAPPFAAAPAADRGTRAVVGVIVSLLVLAVGLLLALPWIAGLVAMRVPVEWEDRFGAAVVESSVPASRRVSDPAVRSVVEGVVERLARAGPSPYTFRVTVADDPAVNAYAAPGGHVVVNTGLLRFAADGDELAAVLAHEMEHVTRRHVTRVMFQRASLSVLAAMVGGQSADAIGSGVGIARTLGELSFGRAAEREADTGGIARLRAAGVRGAAMATMLERLAAEPKGAQPPELLSTHPDPKGRAARMRALASGDEAAATPAVAPAAWAAMRAALGRDSVRDTSAGSF